MNKYPASENPRLKFSSKWEKEEGNQQQQQQQQQQQDLWSELWSLWRENERNLFEDVIFLYSEAFAVKETLRERQEWMKAMTHAVCRQGRGGC